MAQNAKTDFVLPARAVAIASTLAALGLLATLGIVVGVNKVDILSTVALALAILAFVVQLIVYIVQSSSAAQQLADARALHGEMMTVLAELQERSLGTQQSIDLIRQQLIEDLRRKAAKGEGSRHIVDNDQARSVSVETLTDARPLAADQYPENLSAPMAEAINRELSTWPSPEEIPEVVEKLTKMDDELLATLAYLVDDSLQFTTPGRVLGPGVSLSTERMRELIDDGLAENVPGWQLAVPTAKGRKYGRVLTAQGGPPGGIPKELIEIRARAQPA